MSNTSISGKIIQSMGSNLRQPGEIKSSTSAFGAETDFFLKEKFSNVSLTGAHPDLRKPSSVGAQQLSNQVAMDLLVGELGRFTVNTVDLNTKNS
ncbi:hypothetical protein [Yersinia enterocolitica]|uniref:hypothetical protein n=1 Tax=Yersinia enterocolitica TaxID=630 RepID=UPI00398CD8F5